MRLPVTPGEARGAASHGYLVLYKAWLAEQAVTANTARAYHSRIGRFLLFLEYANFSGEPLADAVSTDEAMRLYLDFLKQSKTSDVTINAIINALNNFYRFLGLGESTQLKSERGGYKRARKLTISEQARFLRCVERQSTRDKALAFVFFYTGLQIGDCARLNVENIGAGAACIYLGTDGVVPLNEPTAFALRQWLAERQTLAASGADSRLWLSRQGQRISVSGIVSVIKRIGRRAKLSVSPEKLRRTWLATSTERLNRSEPASHGPAVYRHNGNHFRLSESAYAISPIYTGCISK